MAKTKFQSRHYQDVALIFQDTFPQNKNDKRDAYLQWDAMRSAFMDMFTQDNPLFDAERFNAACVRGADPRKR